MCYVRLYIFFLYLLFQLKSRIKPIQSQFESYREDVDRAQNELQHEEHEDAWDRILPAARDQDTRNEEHIPEVPSLPEQYDLGMDLGLPINVEEQMQPSNEMNDEEYMSKMRQLNQEQIDFVYQVLHHVKTSPEPIFRFLSGGAGVGKTFVTKMLYQALLKYMNRMPGTNPSFPFILLMAPTRKAAHLLKGNTIHSALKVPINQSMEYRSLDADRLNTLRTQLAQVQFIIIDEISMVGSGLLSFINARLKEVFMSSAPFGGTSVLACRDLFQLRPVCDSAIFQPVKTGYEPLARNLWRDTFQLFELKQIMRQDNLDF